MQLELHREGVFTPRTSLALRSKGKSLWHVGYKIERVASVTVRSAIHEIEEGHGPLTHMRRGICFPHNPQSRERDGDHRPPESPDSEGHNRPVDATDEQSINAAELEDTLSRGRNTTDATQPV